MSNYSPTYHDLTVKVPAITAQDTSVHYIEAGNSCHPTVLLLHGFPSSSHQYRNLIPMLSSDYHILAPDLPGFGLTTVPSDFAYTFDNMAAVISAWLNALNVTSYAMYIFDYGAPVGLRLALEKPEQVKAIISQNGNAYAEGLGDVWAPIKNIWASNNSDEAREPVRQAVLTMQGKDLQYTVGFPEKDLPLINPVAWQLDYLSNIQGKENQDRQLDIFYDYRTNVDLYPKFQEYFRKSQVPLLAVWGKGDLFFVPAGAEAFKKDLPNAVVKFVDAGHFALETKRREIAEEIRAFLTGIGY